MLDKEPIGILGFAVVARLQESFRVLPQERVILEARFGLVVACAQEAHVDERPDEAQCRKRFGGPVRCSEDDLRGLDRDAASQYREPAKRAPLWRGEEIVAPSDRVI